MRSPFFALTMRGRYLTALGLELLTRFRCEYEGAYHAGFEEI
jgi:hypothetical protein